MRITVVVALALTVLVARSARGDLDGDEFESATWRVRLTAPRGWLLSETASYPNVLLWMTHRSPRAKMIFSAERLPAPVGAFDYARQTVARLLELGFRVGRPQLHASTGAYWMDLDTRDKALRQAFLVSGMTGYTLTLVVDGSRGRSQHLRAFDSVLRSIQLLRDAPATPDAGPGSKDRPAGPGAFDAGTGPASDVPPPAQSEVPPAEVR